MAQLSSQQVDDIAARVIARLGGVASKAASQPAPKAPHTPTPPATNAQLGVFPDVDSSVAAATTAFQQLGKIPLSKREALIAAIRAKMHAYCEELSELAHSETGLGRYEDKLVKNRLVTEKTPGTEDLAPLARSGDHGLMLTEPAPFGVIAAITPTTNPTSTIICNTIGMVAAGNAVVFNVHPSARRVSLRNVHLINEAIVEAGGPVNVVCAVGQPTVESAQALMKHPGVRLLVVTGGPAVVKVAMNSGKRAICAGPGNPPAVVDETADVEKAGRDIVAGGSFDNNVICTDEKTVIAVDRVADDLLKAMTRNGAVLMTPAQAKQLERVIFSETRGPRRHAVIAKDMIGKSASVILSKIGMNVDRSVRMGLLDVPNDHPLVWSEQMMPILPVTRVRTADEAIDLAVEAELGRRHTASMHSKNLDNLSRMARVMNCSIFIKNGPNYAGLANGGEGWTSFSIASPTGEGLTRARDFSRWRRCTLVDHFRIV